MVDVLGEVDEQRRRRIERSLQAAGGDLAVERVQLVQRFHPVQVAHAQAVADPLEGDPAGRGADQHAGVAVFAADAADREVGGVPEEVGALVAALQRGPVEIADRLVDQDLAVAVLHDHPAVDHVHLADLLQGMPRRRCTSSTINFS